MKFTTKLKRHQPPHLRRVATLPWEIKIKICGRLSTVSCVPQRFNSLLTSRFVQRFSGNSSDNLFAVYPFKYKLFIKILSSSLNTMLIVDKQDADHYSRFECFAVMAPGVLNPFRRQVESASSVKSRLHRTRRIAKRAISTGNSCTCVHSIITRT